MRKLELTIHHTDGTSHVALALEDTPIGRSRIDKTAMIHMARDRVKWVGVERVDKTAGYLK